MFDLARVYNMSDHKYCTGSCRVLIKHESLISISKCRAPKASADKEIEGFPASWYLLMLKESLQELDFPWNLH